jgi:hypothetical protein
MQMWRVLHWPALSPRESILPREKFYMRTRFKGVNAPFLEEALLMFLIFGSCLKDTFVVIISVDFSI